MACGDYATCLSVLDIDSDLTSHFFLLKKYDSRFACDVVFERLGPNHDSLVQDERVREPGMAARTSPTRPIPQSGILPTVEPIACLP